MSTKNPEPDPYRPPWFVANMPGKDVRLLSRLPRVTCVPTQYRRANICAQDGSRDRRLLYTARLRDALPLGVHLPDGKLCDITR